MKTNHLDQEQLLSYPPLELHSCPPTPTPKWSDGMFLKTQRTHVGQAVLNSHRQVQERATGLPRRAKSPGQPEEQPVW